MQTELFLATEFEPLKLSYLLFTDTLSVLSGYF